jgi:hypothetical protein
LFTNAVIKDQKSELDQENMTRPYLIATVVVLHNLSIKYFIEIIAIYFAVGRGQ